MEEGDGVCAFPFRSPYALASMPPGEFEVEASTLEFSLAG